MWGEVGSVTRTEVETERGQPDARSQISKVDGLSGLF